MNTVITGGTKGIGRAIAEAFAAEGSNLAICSRTNKDLEQLTQDFKKRYPDIEVWTKPVDVRNKQEVIEFGNFVKSKWDQIDVLVNNAGVFLPGEIRKEEDGILEKLIETNLYSAYYLTRNLIPAMLLKKRGHIFNICSIASLFAFPNGGSYSISKFAMLGFSKVLREELKEKGVKVTSVMPGATWSNAWAGAKLPYERLIPAEDIAKVVVNAYKLSDSSVVEELIIRPQLGDL